MNATDIYRIAFIEGATKAYALQTERIEQLEQLCRDMSLYVPVPEGGDRHLFYDRMIDLGLLDGEQRD